MWWRERVSDPPGSHVLVALDRLPNACHCLSVDAGVKAPRQSRQLLDVVAERQIAEVVCQVSIVLVGIGAPGKRLAILGFKDAYE